MTDSTTSVQTAAIVWPTLTYRDARAAIRFLEQAFGFETIACYGEGERVDHAELAWPGGGALMLGSAREGSAIKDLPAGVGSVYIVVDDPDALCARAKAAGATMVRDLTDQTDYESRDFVCRDPEGVYWSFGTYAGAKH
ncbi:VOC family protein [Nocardia sp. NPDC127526]|uniref:VOC family protein n=1 Tax=Nocardia sp. NPDC127526 TaxID=3345393 RepID=UPI00362ADD3C